MTHTVLVVEDEEDLREMIREALEMSGYTVVTAAEGQAALDAIESIEHVCVVLLDLLMPGMNGWDFFAELRRRPGFKDVPVVIHTSAPDRAPSGATRVIQKPLVLARLLSLVGEFCQS
ncbi:MAG TPA: response regulator [Polyangiaceae bacterium]|jgi:CheY-like chemotaxis protein|nr:response regulator [Polyangiaceae bacterium]